MLATAELTGIRGARKAVVTISLRADALSLPVAVVILDTCVRVRARHIALRKRFGAGACPIARSSSAARRNIVGTCFFCSLTLRGCVAFVVIRTYLPVIARSTDIGRPGIGFAVCIADEARIVRRHMVVVVADAVDHATITSYFALFGGGAAKLSRLTCRFALITPVELFVALLCSITVDVVIARFGVAGANTPTAGVVFGTKQLVVAPFILIAGPGTC